MMWHEILSQTFSDMKMVIIAIVVMMIAVGEFDPPDDEDWPE
jgi:hypothetical protein